MSKRELSLDVEVVAQPQEPAMLGALKAARAKISEPDKWIQGNYTSFRDPSAYCMLGALGWSRCTEFDGAPNEAADDASWALQRVICGRDIPHFNDDPSTTHADVMAAFDLAIEQATKDWLVAK